MSNFFGIDKNLCLPIVMFVLIFYVYIFCCFYTTSTQIFALFSAPISIMVEVTLILKISMAEVLHIYCKILEQHFYTVANC